jgi:hypothetical protein
MIATADIRRVQEWMGHADIQTTMRYLHYAPRGEDAELVARAFRLAEPPAPAEADQSVPDVRRRPQMSGNVRPAK